MYGGSGISPFPEAPHDARAYELYLRANEMARTYDGLVRARGLYEHLGYVPRFDIRAGLAATIEAQRRDQREQKGRMP